MRQTWRWFGPTDRVSIDDMMQAGAEGAVTALHHVPTGDVWSREEIARRQRELSVTTSGGPSGIKWEVVESLPVSEDIKNQKGAWREHIANYKQSLHNLAAAGLETICYNFMPVLDWTRTDLRYQVAHGGTCMRFDINDFAVFEIHILKRSGAAESFAPEVVAEAARRFAGMDDAAQQQLSRNVTMGLPGSTESMTLDDVRAHLSEYQGISPDLLRRHFVDFLSEVVPVAEEVGVRLCCHPDDPPFPLLGLPRIMSTAADYRHILGAVDSPANGMTFCSGSLGARPDNDLPEMARRFAPRIRFAHLRATKREADGLSFHESAHLDGDVDMVAVLKELVAEDRRRAKGETIVFRSDHGQRMLDDLAKQTTPGYPAIGRLRGLAELRGILRALDARPD